MYKASATMISSSQLLLLSVVCAVPAAAFRVPALQSALPAALNSRGLSSPRPSMLETARLRGDVTSLRVDVGRSQVLSLRMNAPSDWNKLEVVSNTKAAEGHQRILISGGVVHPTYTTPG